MLQAHGSCGATAAAAVDAGDRPQSFSMLVAAATDGVDGDEAEQGDSESLW